MLLFSLIEWEHGLSQYQIKLIEIPNLYLNVFVLFCAWHLDRFDMGQNSLFDVGPLKLIIQFKTAY